MNLQEQLLYMERGLAAVGKESPKFMAAFNRLDETAYADGAISREHKGLMAVAVSVATRCSYCIVHQRGALLRGGGDPGRDPRGGADRSRLWRLTCTCVHGCRSDPGSG